MTRKINAFSENCNQFNQLITDIWKKQTIPRDEIADRIKKFTTRDWLLLAGVDSISFWGGSGGTFIYGGNEVSAVGRDGSSKLRVKLVDESSLHNNTYFHYQTCNKLFKIDGPVDQIGIIERDAVRVVEVISYLYFHTGSLLLMPFDMRQERISVISNYYEMLPQYLINMIGWLNVIDE